MTALQEAARKALKALEVATTPLAKDRQEVLTAMYDLRTALAQQGELAEQMVSNTAMDYQLRALDICREAKKVSVSLVQRKLGLSYAAAQELCQSIVASGLVPGLPIAPSLIDVMAAAAQPVAPNHCEHALDMVVRELTDEGILEKAHRICWRYKHSSDPHHSDTYTFNKATMLDFVRAIEKAMG